MAGKNRTDNRRLWEKENMKSFTIRCNVKSEKTMTDWLEEHKPIQSYIKGLIREDMNRN